MIFHKKRFVQTNKLDTKFDYYYMLTPKSNINLTLEIRIHIKILIHLFFNC